MTGSPSSIAVLIVMLMMLVACPVVALIADLVRDSAINASVVAGGIILGFLAVWTRCVWHALRAPRPYIIAASDMIIMHEGWTRAHFLSWSEVKKIDVVPRRQHLQLRIAAGSLGHTYRFFVKRDDHAAEVIEYIRFHAPHVVINGDETNDPHDKSA